MLKRSAPHSQKRELGSECVGELLEQETPRAPLTHLPTLCQTAGLSAHRTDVAPSFSGMANSEDAAVQFALYCLVHHQCEKPPHESCVAGLITRLQCEYTKIFKKPPSKATVVNIMMSGAVYELPQSPGSYVHALTVFMPDYARAVLEHLDITVSFIDAYGTSNVPTWSM